MNDTTRRNFISVAGVGTAAGVAVALAPGASAGTPHSAPATLPVGASGAMAAYVHDVRSGVVTLMIDGHEVAVTDKSLVAHLARAYAKAAKTAARD